MTEKFYYSEAAKLFKDKFPDYIKDIVLPTNNDFETISKAELLLEKFNNNDPEKFFLLSLINFLKCSIITYHSNKLQSHGQRRKWLNSLMKENGLSSSAGKVRQFEKEFLENNRLRVNKFFPLLWAIDNLPDDLKFDLEKFWQLLGSENYNKLSDEEKIKVLNDFKEYCLQIFNQLKSLKDIEVK
jgi:hypothetical protein